MPGASGLGETDIDEFDLSVFDRWMPTVKTHRTWGNILRFPAISN